MTRICAYIRSRPPPFVPHALRMGGRRRASVGPLVGQRMVAPSVSLARPHSSRKSESSAQIRVIHANPSHPRKSESSAQIRVKSESSPASIRRSHAPTACQRKCPEKARKRPGKGPEKARKRPGPGGPSLMGFVAQQNRVESASKAVTAKAVLAGCFQSRRLLSRRKQSRCPTEPC